MEEVLREILEADKYSEEYWEYLWSIAEQQDLKNFHKNIANVDSL